MPGLQKKIFIVSRCGWTLYNFRRGLINHLIQNGYDVTIAGAKDEYLTRLKESGIKIFALPIKARSINPLTNLFLLCVMIKWYKKEKPDIVHHFTIKPVIIGSLAAKIAKIKIVVNTITGLGYAFTGERYSIKRITMFLYKMALKNTQLTFFQNNDDANMFSTNGLIDATRSQLISGTGVDLEYFKMGAHIPSESIRFLMMSRLLRDKGVMEFYNAATIVKSKYEKVKFILVGGTDKNNPTTLSESLLKKWRQDGIVEIVGKVDNVKDYISMSDVIVLPSYREGVSRSLLEAAAMAKPIITTDVPGCREIVQNGLNGILIPPKDVYALVEAMTQFILNKNIIAEYGKNSRKIAEHKFNEKDIINQIVNSYNRLTTA